MTTFDEISSSEKANFEFWSQRAKLNLFCYRQHRRGYGENSGITKLDKSGFRAAMKNRRMKTYLDS